MELTGTFESPRTKALQQMLQQYHLKLTLLPADAEIPGSHWGAPEAGLLGQLLYARPDTPIHSVLHESCHFVCMDSTRREVLDTDAGGSAVEECAVCYLSILLATQLCGYGRGQMLDDMDAWGYSFRLGSAKCWFYDDAQDARQWLLEHQLLDHKNNPTWMLRET